MALDFPSSPSLNQVYTYGSYSWRWDGTSWVGAVPIVNATINNTTIGATTSSTGAFTSLTSTSGAINGTVGATTANTGAFTTLSASSTVTLSGGTANGVAYLNGSKVLTTGTALTFDGTNLAVGASATSSSALVYLSKTAGSSDNGATGATLFLNSGSELTTANLIRFNGAIGQALFYGRASNADAHTWGGSASGELMRLNTTGLAVTGALSATDTISTTKAVASAGNIVSIKNSTDTGGDNTRYAGVNFLVGSDDGTSSIRSYRTNSANNYETALAFLTNPSGATQTPTEKMRITSTGNVGIGMTPTSKLQILTSGPAFSVPAQNSIGGSSANRVNLVGGEPGLVLITDINGSGYQTGTGTASMGMAIGFYTTNDLRSQIFWSGTPLTFTYASTPTGSVTERMRIDSSGNVGIGTSNPAYKLDVSGSINCSGALSKGSGSFRINHPLPKKSATHQLVHSFIEGPKADLIYRGKVVLVDGKASVNIDTASTMTEGTFEVLCREVQCFTTNESGWTAVRGKVTGNILTIEAKDADCVDEISWMVIGERQDPHMMETDWTDDNGKVIVEPLKPSIESN